MPGLAFIRLSNGCSAGQVIDVCMTRSHDLYRIIEIPLPGSFVFLGRCIDNLVHLGMFFDMLFKSGMAVGLDVYLRLGNSASQVGSEAKPAKTKPTDSVGLEGGLLAGL